MIRIASIDPSGLAAELGLKPGDRIAAINGNDVSDIIDFRFLVSDERIRMKVATGRNGARTISFTKEPDDMMGIEFEPFPIRRCGNHCIFCFVDQMPPDCRKTLYVKDDDYRASFLYGNYITLGSLTEAEWERIFSLRLSPLYISVHATDPELRARMLGRAKPSDILSRLERLAENGIMMHTQIVLCPGVNDGAHLRRTLDDLVSLFPAVQSIAVVPVGLTGYREGLHPLRTFTRSEARALIAEIEGYGKRLRRRFGTRLIYPSDELFIKAALPFPRPSYYEEFAQIENGVGMVTDFLEFAGRVRLPKRVPPIRVTIVTGQSFAPILKKALLRWSSVDGLTLKLVTAPNRFFGGAVTVAGLLTGGDIAAALQRKRLGDLVIIPAETLNDNGLFLDGMTREQLESSIGARIVPAATMHDILRIIKDAERNNA